jgi:large subunit ribosomal protein L1
MIPAILLRRNDSKAFISSLSAVAKNEAHRANNTYSGPPQMYRLLQRASLSMTSSTSQNRFMNTTQFNSGRTIFNHFGYFTQHSQSQMYGCHHRTYISRAHPKPRPEFAIPDAIKMVYEDVERRRAKRHKREEYHEKKATPEKPARKLNHPSETLELAIMLNLDPRKPGQSLRGSITLPHGTGKKGQNVIVLTKDEGICEAAKAGGAYHAGGESIIDQIVSGEIAVDSINSVLAMPDIMPTLSKKAARLLGPRGLMPNAKVGTIHNNMETLLASLNSAVAGKEITFRTEKEGIVHVPIGKDTFPISNVLDNIGTIMKAIMDVKPDSYGKGKKKSSGKKGQAVSAKNQPKYLLRVTLSSTQSMGVRVDLRTIDPSSAFFLSTLDPIQASQKNILANTSDSLSNSDVNDVDGSNGTKMSISAEQ